MELPSRKKWIAAAATATAVTGVAICAFALVLLQPQIALMKELGSAYGQGEALDVNDTALDQEFIAEMMAKRPDSFEYPYTYMESAGSDSLRIEQMLDMGGVRYQLVSQADAQADPSWTRPTKTAAATVTKSVPAADIDCAQQYFDSELSYSQDGYEGVLVRSAQVSATPEHEVLSRQVDRTCTFSGLETNDASVLPQVRTFEVSSASGSVSKDLELSDATFQVETYAPDGTPATYLAQANYRGVEEYLTTPGYTVTYAYEGVVSLSDTQMVINVRYDALLPWGEALVGVLAFGPVAGVADFLAEQCS